MSRTFKDMPTRVREARRGYAEHNLHLDGCSLKPRSVYTRELERYKWTWPEPTRYTIVCTHRIVRGWSYAIHGPYDTASKGVNSLAVYDAEGVETTLPDLELEGCPHTWDGSDLYFRFYRTSDGSRVSIASRDAYKNADPHVKPSDRFYTYVTQLNVFPPLDISQGGRSCTYELDLDYSSSPLFRSTKARRTKRELKNYRHEVNSGFADDDYIADGHYTML